MKFIEILFLFTYCFVGYHSAEYTKCENKADCSEFCSGSPGGDCYNSKEGLCACLDKVNKGFVFVEPKNDIVSRIFKYLHIFMIPKGFIFVIWLDTSSNI